MIPDLILFLILALIAVVSAVGMLFSQNAVYSALSLIINMSTVAVFYLLLDAPFIAMAQITVYAGAIMVLFLFVIMLLGAERLGGQPLLRWQRPAALLMGVILLAETVYILVFRTGALPAAQAPEAGFGSPIKIGELLFNQYLLPFEATSILLLISMIGVIVLTKRKA